MQLENLFDPQQVDDACSLPCLVVLVEHVGALAAEHLDVIRLVVVLVTILVMHHLTRLELTAKLSLSNGAVQVVSLPCSSIPAACVGVVLDLRHDSNVHHLPNVLTE